MLLFFWYLFFCTFSAVVTVLGGFIELLGRCDIGEVQGTAYLRDKKRERLYL
jgi:hypothetical protein